MFEKKFLMPLLCLVVALSLSAAATRGANILFVSSMSADHMVGDDALKAFMEGLGHTVTYIDDDEDEATTEAAAAAADLVFISESCGSGNIKNEITELEVPMIVGEPYAWDEMGLTEGGGGDDPVVTTDLEIVDPGHYLAAGLSGTVAVLTDITSALGVCSLGKGIVGPEATVIATATLSDGQTYDVIFVYEKGAALPVAPADGSPQLAADIRIGFGFHLYCDPVLNENAYAMLGAAVDYALGLTGPPVGANIIWVSYHGADDAPSGDAAGAGFTEAPDKGYTDLLKANGYNVTRYITTGTPDVSVLNAADLVIIGRSAASGHYQNDAATTWNATVTAPMIITCGYKLRSSRMGFTTGTDMPDTTGDIRLTVADPTHPIFDGIALTDGTMDNTYAGVVTHADGTLARGISINNNPVDDEGTILATIAEASADTGPVGGMVIGEWPVGATLTHAGGAETDVLAGPRLVFLTGSREPSGISSHTAGIIDLYPDGAQMLLNAVNYMIPVKAPAGPVGHWMLDEGEGAVAVDLSGRGNDGTIHNADAGGLGDGGSVWFNDPERGMVISFNGEADGAYVRAGDIPQMTLTIDFTWAFWAKQDAGNTTPNDIIFGNRKDDAGADFVPRQFIKFTPTKFEWHMNGNGNDNLEYDDIPADVWLHHAVVKAGDQLTYYRNGIEASSGTFTQPLDFPQPLFFGGDNENAAGENWRGLMSDARIYDRALSADEIRQLAGTPVDPGTEGLLAAYKFETDATDGSGNGNDGTFLGDAHVADGVLVLDGEGDAVAIPRIGGADATFSQLTYSMMVYPTVDQIPLQFSGGLNTNDWNSGAVHIKLNYGNINVGINGLAGGDLVGTTIVLPDMWSHMVLTVSETEVALYLNGVLEDSRALDAPLTNLIVGGGVIGGWAHPDVDRELTGMMDDVLIYDRALSVGEIRYLAGFRPILDPGTEDLVAHWTFDEGDGTIAVDSSPGGGNDGILIGTAMSWMPNDGMIGGALSFDGTASDADYVEISTADISLAAGTVAMWGKLGPDPQLPATRYFCGHTTIPAWSDRIQLYMDDSDTILDLGLGDSHNRHKDIMSLTTETWYHVALTWDGGNYVVYVNGEEKANGTYTGLDSLNPVADIGNDGNTDGRTEAFNGLLDDVRIYDLALSEAEIRYLAIRSEPVENLLQNPSFEEDEAVLDDPDWVNWCTWNPAEGAGSNATIVDTEAIDGTRSLRIEPKGTENWHFIVLYLPIFVDMDKDYNISFWAKAEEPRPLTMALKAEDNSIDAWGATDFELTTDWAEYQYTSEVLIDIVKLEIWCSGSEVPFWLDLISVNEAN